MPRLACDTHMHVFGPAAIYPRAAGAKYTLPSSSAEDYAAVAKALQIERVVLVQPSFYGTDNSCLLNLMEKMRQRCRAVVFLPDGVPASLIDDFQRRGVRGVRLDFFKADAAGLKRADQVTLLNRTARLAKDVGWHVELYSPGRVTFGLLEHLGQLDVEFSINHMGYMTREEGLNEEHFRRFIALVKSRRCWVKLTGPYRVAKDGVDELPDWMARELIAAAPDRMLWGTDWPHIPSCSIDTGQLLNRLALWCPDESARSKLLVDNPARLYQFDTTGI
jgi:predicted TIM-barrel fold metal-dependent hydrolase